ncbi:uncharacterized protein LOC110418038 [Herrania umbratica]|uniref:Uncharacterized protein LOC110418038 n=1 Tax=Herrania umbratica TaxID=108875 RepID=A0A6J1AGJ1_9ROSI|nr:uncharacterized protein LOC110418038 [Herrania umbratica]XP_021286328.1 uncharacterized protein LOC110418038 [Herrania umbratica]
MESSSVPESSLSNVKSSRSEKNKMKKQRKHRAIQNGSAELKEEETSLGTDSNLESKADVSLDSGLQEGENWSSKDACLETEHLTRMRRKKKRKENSLIDASKVNVSVELGLKEEVHSSVKDTLVERDSHLGTLENIGSNSGLKESQLNEQPAHSERKRKRKKDRKKAVRGQNGEEGPKAVLLFRDGKENSIIDENLSHSHVESKVNVSLESVEKSSLEPALNGSQLNEQPADSEKKRKRKRAHKMAKAGQFEKLDQKSAVEPRDGKENSLIDEMQSASWDESKLNVSLESGLKEGANSLMEDSLWERDSHVETLNKISLGSVLKGSQLNEQLARPERKRRRRGKRKVAKPEQFEKLDAKCVLVLRDRKENSLIDEKQNDSHMEFKMHVSSESGLKEEANQDVETLENISLESGMKGTQLNEQTVQSERKRKRKKEKQERTRLSVLEDNDVSSRRNDRDDNEAENNNMCPVTQITNRKEDLMSISENVELKNMKGNSLIPDKQSDSPRTASTSRVKTQDLRVDGDLVIPELKDNKTFQIGKIVKTYHRKRKKSSDLLGDTFEPVQENGMIQSSIDHLEKEPTTGISERRLHGVLLGEHAMPARLLEEAFGNSTGSEAALKGRKRKRAKKLKESLCKYPDQKDVKVETNMEEFIPSPSNLVVAKDDVALKATVKENTLSRTLYPSLERICSSHPKKKLLVLDLNGILVDVVQNPGEFKPDIRLSGKGVFKRPFCDDFLEFCFRTFNVGIWSSRINKNVKRLVGFLLKKWRRNLLFCWHRKQCTKTKFKTIEDKKKPLVLKELSKLWGRQSPNVPWEKGEYDESNTLLLDDSPYKALHNPANTAVFPYPYQYRDTKDSSLGCGGDIRTYVEGLAAAENVQKYVEQNPFGQPAITESNPHWDFYCQIIDKKK